jgi:carboxymethylenebutenolidase
MQRKHAADFDQRVLDLYDDFAHGRISRRDFLEGATKFAVGGLTAEAMLASLTPNYAWAQQVAKDDPRLKTEYIEYASPKGADVGHVSDEPSDEDSRTVVFGCRRTRCF